MLTNTFRAAALLLIPTALMVSPVAMLTNGHGAQGPGLVSYWHLPAGGIQPQAAVDSKGAVHVIYYKDGPTAGMGNLFYLQLAPGKSAPSMPIRVNSIPNSAGSVGTVRAAQLAVGSDNRVHVVWNGLGEKGSNGYPEIYEAYTHLNDAGTAFEPQRNLTTWAHGLDGGGSVAADRVGNVYVTWHAMANAKDESGRAVFVAHSADNGATFAREVQANPLPTGACGCCGMRATVDSNGVLYVVYRAAGEKIHRDTMLLVSRDQGRTFEEKRVDPWQLNSCPMSTYSLAAGSGRVLASWETAGRVCTATIDAQGLYDPRPVQRAGTDQKHPFLAASANGTDLLVWTEGTGWQRGGALCWQVISPGGTMGPVTRKADAIPVWGLATAYAKPDGSFVIIY